MYTPSGLKVQNDYQTHHHHHRGQIDHTIITFTHPQGAPQSLRSHMAIFSVGVRAS